MNFPTQPFPLLKVSNLDVVFKQQNQPDFVAAQDVSFQLDRG